MRWQRSQVTQDDQKSVAGHDRDKARSPHVLAKLQPKHKDSQHRCDGAASLVHGLPARISSQKYLSLLRKFWRRSHGRRLGVRHTAAGTLPHAAVWHRSAACLKNIRSAHKILVGPQLVFASEIAIHSYRYACFPMRSRLTFWPSFWPAFNTKAGVYSRKSGKRSLSRSITIGYDMVMSGRGTRWHKSRARRGALCAIGGQGRFVRNRLLKPTF